MTNVLDLPDALGEGLLFTTLTLILLGRVVREKYPYRNQKRRMKIHAKNTPLSSWQRIEVARHAARPRTLFFVERLFEDFLELHGDRVSGDDPAIIGGIARFEGRTVMVVGHQKGVTTDEKVQRNFGMAHPEGYRKALRLMRMAEHFSFPVITFVDTPAAYPGVEAEERGQGSAIAKNLMELSSLKIPLFAAVLGEGGSGGALGLAVADYIVMLEHAVYMICPPERCAEILWRDEGKKHQAAEALRVTARDLLAFGVIDKVLSEPEGGAHISPEAMVSPLKYEIHCFLEKNTNSNFNYENRQNRLRNIGIWNSAINTEG